MKPTTLLFLFLCFIPIYAQNLPELLRQRSKAVVSVSSLSTSDEWIKRGNGFFISPDGLLLMPSSLLVDDDSVVVTLFNGRKIGVDRVVSMHRYYNLAMVKVKGGRDFEYLSPARQTIREPEEILVLVHESAGAASEVGRISGVGELPRLTRMGILDTRLTSASAGAPVLNGKGGWIGVFFEDNKSGVDCVLSSLMLQDEYWISVGLSPRLIRQKGAWRNMARPDFLMGMMACCRDEYGEASKNFSLFLKHHGDDLLAYSARANMRRLYGNNEGFDYDVTRMHQLYPDDGLCYYIQAMYLVEQERFDEAMARFNECLRLSPSFGAAYLAMGNLVLKRDKNVRKAFDLFSMALMNDSLLAQAYLERGKLLLQHSSSRDKALGDFHQCIYLDPTQEGVFTLRGTCFFEHRNYAAAIRDFDEALKRNPLDLHAWFNRGMVHYNVGLKERACSDWEKSSRLGNELAYKYISRYCQGVANTFF